MRFGRVNYLIGKVIVVVGVAMLLPLLCALIYKDGDAAAFAMSIPICLVCGLALVYFSRQHRGEKMRRRDSLLFVTLVWLGSALFGSLPFLFAGVFPDFAGCFFESMSGFTTTGASALSVVEAQPHGILLWRSLTHWLGGAGVVLIFVALIRRRDDRGEGIAISQAEFSGGNLEERVLPRIETNAQAVFSVYLGLTLLCLLFLLAGGMSFFDAANHSMSTLATGGFSTKTMSIEAFGSGYIEWVISFFMMAGGINFGLIYMLLIRRKFRLSLRNQELRLYLFVIAAATVLLTICLACTNTYPQGGVDYALRKSVFQAASIITTTGFSSANFDLWPDFARFLLICLMLAGGCSGSTAGSIKMSRWFVALRTLGTELVAVFRPKAVRAIYYNGKMVGRDMISRMTNYFFLYIGLAFVGGLALTLAGMDWTEAITSAMSALGNVGPAVGSVGPAGSFAAVSDAAKWILSFLMLVGRLELYTVLVLFLPGVWKK